MRQTDSEYTWLAQQNDIGMRRLYDSKDKGKRAKKPNRRKQRAHTAETNHTKSRTTNKQHEHMITHTHIRQL